MKKRYQKFLQQVIVVQNQRRKAIRTQDLGEFQLLDEMSKELEHKAKLLYNSDFDEIYHLPEFFDREYNADHDKIM